MSKVKVYISNDPFNYGYIDSEKEINYDLLNPNDIITISRPQRYFKKFTIDIIKKDKNHKLNNIDFFIPIRKANWDHYLKSMKAGYIAYQLNSDNENIIRTGYIESYNTSSRTLAIIYPPYCTTIIINLEDIKSMWVLVISTELEYLDKDLIFKQL